jgi:hypothetical protein
MPFGIWRFIYQSTHPLQSPCTTRLLSASSLPSPVQFARAVFWSLHMTSHTTFSLWRLPDRTADRARPPQVRALTFPSSTRHIYALKFGQYWTLLCLASSSASVRLYAISVRRAKGVCLQLHSDSTSRWTPFWLRLLLSGTEAVHVSSQRPCWAHIEKGGTNHAIGWSRLLPKYGDFKLALELEAQTQ